MCQLPGELLLCSGSHLASLASLAYALSGWLDLAFGSAWLGLAWPGLAWVDRNAEACPQRNGSGFAGIFRA